MNASRLSFLLLCLATAATAQNPNNTLRGKVLYQSSGNKPAVGVRIAEPDATAVFSVDNGDYLLKFQNKRNGAALTLEVGKNDGKSRKLELVNEKEVKGAKLPASMEEALDIIVCPAGQRDIAAQKYYRIMRTTADRELEKKKKEVESLLAQKEKDYQKISDLFAQLDRMQAALDSAKIREQALNIASINLDRASELVKDAVKKIEEENDVEGALNILNREALDTAYQDASALMQKADAAIRQVIEGYKFKVTLLMPQYKYRDLAECYERMAEIYEKEDYDEEILAIYLLGTAYYYGFNRDYQKALEFNLKALDLYKKILPTDHPLLATSYNNLSWNYAQFGEYQKALEFDLKALTIRKKSLPADDPLLATSYNNLSQSYSDLNEYSKVLKFGLRSLAILEKVLPADHPNLITSYSNIGSAYRNVGEIEKGIYYGQKAIQIGEGLNPKHINLNSFYANLGITYIKAKQYPEAEASFEKSESLKAEERVYRGWAMYYALQNNKAKAIENLQKSISFGYRNMRWVETDDSLESIRGEQGYKDIVDQLKKQ